MAIRRVTDPSDQPVTRDEAKLHLRVTDDREDTLIDSLILAATGEVEKTLRRSLISQQWRISLDRFPSLGVSSTLQQRIQASRSPGHVHGRRNGGRELFLQFPPTISVDTIDYIDKDGALQTLSSALYDVDNENEPGRIVLKDTESWPETDRVPNAVTIEYTAGYGALGSSVPAPIRQAILLTVGHLFENRETVVMAPGIVVAEVPRTADWLLAPYRIIEFA